MAGEMGIKSRLNLVEMCIHTQGHDKNQIKTTRSLAGAGNVQARRTWEETLGRLTAIGFMQCHVTQEPGIVALNAEYGSIVAGLERDQEVFQ